MRKEFKEYEVLVQEKVKVLEEKVGHRITHGSKGTCTSCGHIGFYDLQPGGLTGSAIFYSASLNEWRCMACDHAAHSL